MARFLNALLILLAIGALQCACDGSAKKGGKPTSTSPAEVTHRVQESDLTTVRLTPEAVKRLGIRTTPAEIKDILRTRTYPGEMIIPDGRDVIVSAPATGVVMLPPNRTALAQPGSDVTQGDPFLLLVPGETGAGQLLTASDRLNLAKAQADVLAAKVEAEGQVRQAEVRVNAAKIRLDRAEKLRRENAGSQRTHDEAMTEYQLANAGHASSIERLTALRNVLEELDAGRESAITIVAPLTGQVRALHVAPNQLVPVGAPLFEVGDSTSLRVRVPVPVGDYDRIRTDANAEVQGLARQPGAPGLRAAPVVAPKLADPIASAIHLYFEVDDPEGRLRPGQRVAVVLKTRDQDRWLVVPSSAVLHDIHGGTWVYQATKDSTYLRRRVSVTEIVSGCALLDRGPSPGTMVVTDGAVELFGTEFGAGK